MILDNRCESLRKFINLAGQEVTYYKGVSTYRKDGLNLWNICLVLMDSEVHISGDFMDFINMSKCRGITNNNRIVPGMGCLMVETISRRLAHRKVLGSELQITPLTLFKTRKLTYMGFLQLFRH